MTDLRTAAKAALWAFQYHIDQTWPTDRSTAAITALRAALAQQDEPVQEPVAWSFEARHIDTAWGSAVSLKHPGREHKYMRNVKPLYLAPPQRKPLTEDEIDVATAQERDALLDHIYEYGTAAEGVLERIRKLCRATEQAHGIGEQP